MIARSELDALHDDLYVLACAVDDAERDLTAGRSETDDQRTPRGIIDWLLDAAKPLEGPRTLRTTRYHPPKRHDDIRSNAGADKWANGAAAPLDRT